MKKLLAIAAFLLASTAAQAQYSFEYGGRTIRIDPDRGTVSIPGVYDNTGKKIQARAEATEDNERPRASSRRSRPRSDPPGDRRAAPGRAERRPRLRTPGAAACTAAAAPPTRLHVASARP